MKTKNLKLKIKDTQGQLLIELLIALFVGGVFLLGATLGITSILRYSFETRGNQAAAGFANDIINQAQLLTTSNWHGLYDLSKGSTNHYFLNQRGSVVVVIPGTESVLYNDVTKGLVGQWKFDEDIGTTTYDTSGNGNDGTLYNAPGRLSSANCITGNCMSFNGTNQYVATVATTTVSSTDFSVVFWMKTPATGSNVNILQKGSSTFNTGGVGLEVRARTAKLEICVANGVGTCTRLSSTNSAIPANTWMQVAIIYNKTTGVTSVFKDGVFNASTTLVTGGFADTFPLNIGKGTDSYFSGSLDDVRIYNRVLSADEIKSLYESPVYNRYFFVDNVSRDSSLNIVTSGGIIDPSTQKMTAGVTWEGGRQLQLYHYFMRNNVFILHNNSWIGSGNTGTTTSATSIFATSSNIFYSTSTASQITLATTTASGWLESATLDTQVSGGAAINSLLWQGSQPTGTNVTFQIAMSNSDSGPWSYAGYDGSGSTYFSPASPNVSVDVENFHNYRYFRYKIFLNPSGGAGPTITDAIINWSK